MFECNHLTENIDLRVAHYEAMRGNHWGALPTVVFVMLPQKSSSEGESSGSVELVLMVSCAAAAGHFAYKARSNKDTLHIKHKIIRTLCI